jgi:hypothetical protein
MGTKCSSFMPYFPIKDHIKPMPSAHKEGPNEEMRLV